MAFNQRDMIFIALFAAITAALGLIPQIMLPIANGVPITAQTLGVMLAGVILGSKRGAAAMLLFIALVALGLPLLAGGRGGIGVFAGPTVGFLMSWPIGAFVAGLIMEKSKNNTLWISAFVAALIGGILVVYLIGIPVLAFMISKPISVVALGSAVFIPGDLIKAILCTLITVGVVRARPSALLSRAE